MRRILALILSVVAIQQSAHPENSVIVGHGISSDEVPSLGGVDDWNVFFLWTLDAKRTVSGPKVTGRVRALNIAHAGAMPKFVRSVELFVLSPITESTAQVHNTGANYWIVALSPRHKGSMYCTAQDPRDVGILIDGSQITVNEHGVFCFKKVLLK
jgi:hypothetical protein